MRVLRIKPELGELAWLRGSVPTPYGEVKISHTRCGDKIYTEVSAPNEIKIIYDGCAAAK
jgi:hypothetical protein